MPTLVRLSTSREEEIAVGGSKGPVFEMEMLYGEEKINTMHFLQEIMILKLTIKLSAIGILGMKPWIPLISFEPHEASVSS